MPAAKPPEFRRRAVDLARRGDASVRQVAKDLGISESCLRRWMAQDDVDAGRREGLTSEVNRRGFRAVFMLAAAPGGGQWLQRSGLLRPRPG